MSVNKCKIESCNGKKVARGLCRKHWHKERILEKPFCKVAKCKNRVLAKDLCSRHYQLQKKYGSTNDGSYVMKIRKAITHSDGTRTCSRCEIRQPIENFHKDKNASDGYRSHCKSCRVAHVKKWYKENQPRQLRKHQDYYENNLDKIRIRDKARYKKDKPKRLELASEASQIRRARKKKAKVDKGISKLSLRKRLGDYCYYCKIEMDFTPASGRVFKDSHATIEHLIPLSKGGSHTWENCVLACQACNKRKHAKSEDEWLKVLEKRAKKKSS